MFCTKCGNELQEGAAFCSRCGNRISQEKKVSLTKSETENAAQQLSKEPLQTEESFMEETAERIRNTKEAHSTKELYSGNVILDSAEPYTDVMQWHYWLNLAVMLLAIPAFMLMGHDFRQAFLRGILTGFFAWGITRLVIVDVLSYRYDKIRFYLPYQMNAQELEQVLKRILREGEAKTVLVSKDVLKVEYNGLILHFYLEEDNVHVSWRLSLGKIFIIGRGWNAWYIYRAVSTVSYLVYGIQQELFRNDPVGRKYYKNVPGVYQKVKPTKANRIFKGTLAAFVLIAFVWAQLEKEDAPQDIRTGQQSQENSGQQTQQSQENSGQQSQFLQGNQEQRTQEPDISQKKDNFATPEDRMKEQQTIDYFALYQPVLSQIPQTGGTALQYCLYDLDQDGIFELIAQNGDTTGGYMADIYTIADGVCQYLGSEYIYYGDFYAAEDGDGVFISYGHMGNEHVYRLAKVGTQITVNELWSIETGRLADFYRNSCPVNWYDMADTAILQNPAAAAAPAIVEVPKDYILRTSNCSYLTEAQLQGLDESDCKIARNEIYARYGRMFSDPELQAYFDGKSWYYGVYEPEAFDDSVLNDMERANLELIVQYEEKRGFR